VLVPCIDLQAGRAVQLVNGRRRVLAVRDVLGLLERFKAYPWLHVIDLDAALGTGRNDALVRVLCRDATRRYGIKVRVGGGIRTVRRATQVLGWGAKQIVIGSAAFRDGKVNERFFRTLHNKVDPQQIVVALDVAQGHIVIHGWRKSLKLRPEDVMSDLKPFCAAFLCTDVDREGTMRGANLRWFQTLRSAVAHPIIAAGGVKTRRELRALEKIGMDAAVGMALYTNRLR
jgi:phosphoribosylformimino-5-aminoimidazole carboxamide ribotide isomerase